MASDQRPASPAGHTRPAPDAAAHREWEVAAENRAASSISTFDARWVVAARAADALEGGRAAVLRPDARERLVANARQLGLRPFDANLVIAIVQDAARCGRDPLSLDTVGQLSMVAPAARARRTPSRAWLLGSLALGAVWALLLIVWFTG